jgi:DNA polymerase-3 subunit gamma/tau
MSYLVLARKWRPNRFDEVVGQTHVTKTLANAIEMDRVAHAFLFSGVRGVGKTSLARILAKALNCKEGPTPTPCGTCDSCTAIASGGAVDVIEIDGASNNSVEDIRNLRETVPFRPVLGKFKIYVIDEVHMLSMSAFNALLKTLEEPPSHVKFIFATTEPHKIPVTIHSRCQRYDFRRIPTVAIVERLKTILESEGIASEEAALSLIGREAEGSMRDGLSILDQVLAAESDRVTADAVAELLGVVERQVLYDVSRAVLDSDPRRCLEIVKDVDNRGYDISTFSKGLLGHIRNLVVAAHCKGDTSLLDLPDEEATELVEQTQMASTDTLHRFFKHFAEAYESIARSSHPRILLETALARIASLGDLVPASEILARLERLARQGALPSPAGTPSSPPKSGGPGPGRPAGPESRSATSAASASPAAMPPGTPPSASPNPSPDPAPQGAISETDWARVTAAIRQSKPAIASSLEFGLPEISGNRLTITYSREYAKIAELASDRLDEIEEALLPQLPGVAAVAVSVGDAARMPNAARQRIENDDMARMRREALERRREEAAKHPLVKKIQSVFDASISEIQLVDGD